jgi:hypothetical protein
MKTVRFFLFLVIATQAGVSAGDFSKIVAGRINSKDEARRVTEELCLAFPKRAGEIVAAVGVEYPTGIMAAALVAAKAAPGSASDISEAARAALPSELSSSVADLIHAESQR